MGFFSFVTRDSHKPIPNIHQSTVQPFPVIMVTPNGECYKEIAYQGYGVFSGKCYYQALAEINGVSKDDAYELEGPRYLYPQFFENGIPAEIDFSIQPEECSHQGFFYPKTEDRTKFIVDGMKLFAQNYGYREDVTVNGKNSVYVAFFDDGQSIAVCEVAYTIELNEYQAPSDERGHFKVSVIKAHKPISISCDFMYDLVMSCCKAAGEW